MGEIYKITNRTNGKCYIGKTKYNSIRRWKDHIYGYHPNSLIHKAIEKYGVDSFSFEIIETNLNEDQLNDFEMYHIKIHNSKTPHGYNLTDGGDGGKGLIVSEETREKQSQLRRNKPWGDRRREVGQPKLIGNHHAIEKSVVMLDEEGNILQIFDSISDASRKTGISRSGISKVCRHEKQTRSGGYRWRYL